MTRLLVLPAIVVAATLSLSAQGPAPITPRPSFEVASVKKNTSGEFGGSIGGRPGQVTVRNNTLRNIVRNVYRLQDFQIVGGPSWFDTERFDITGRAPVETTQDDMMLMVQELLADRFKLVLHMETRQLPVYVLLPSRADGRPGPKLTMSTVDCAALVASLAAARQGGAPPPTPTAGAQPFCGTRTTPGRIQGSSVTMANFGRNLSNFAGRMVIDRTGLAGSWDLELQWTPDPGMMPALPPNAPPLPAPDPNGPSLFTAIQEQLGLKLDSQRGPVDVLVIDSAQQPSPD
ncbi:MAG: TIGR03435 family protein [Vicinamibacterales bacterium]